MRFRQHNKIQQVTTMFVWVKVVGDEPTICLYRPDQFYLYELAFEIELDSDVIYLHVLESDLFSFRLSIHATHG